MGFIYLRKTGSHMARINKCERRVSAQLPIAEYGYTPAGLLKKTINISGESIR